MSWKVKIAFCAMLMMGLPVIGGASAIAADDRTPVTLPPEIKARFLAEMRGHMGNLDDILSALAEGNFNEAADVAAIHMDFGHSVWGGMMEEGMSADQAIQMKEMMRSQGMGMGQGQGMGKGMGRFMPEDFRAMGGSFHEAAAVFATRARAAAARPTVKDYRETTEALQEVTAACRGCHEVFRVE